MDLEALRHSAAHIMADAVKRLYPKAKLGIGPAITDGFYYDFDIEQEMVMRALKRGRPVTEVASHEYERKAGSSKLPTYRGFIFLWRLLVEMITR